MSPVHLLGDELVSSATDVSNFLACARLTALERARAVGGPGPPKIDDPGAEVLRRRGLEHEAQIVEGYRARGLDSPIREP